MSRNHAHSYPWLSPWSYCAANPVRYVDPSGEDHFLFNLKGELIVREFIEDYDRVAVVNEKGVEKGSAMFEYGTIESATKITQKGGTIDILKVRGDDNGTTLFELLADHTEVEFTQIKCGVEGAEGLNFVVSGHDTERESGQAHLIFNQLRYGYIVREHIHNHPSGSLNASDSDIDAAKERATILNSQKIISKIYTTEPNEYNEHYFYYNQDTPKKNKR